MENEIDLQVRADVQSEQIARLEGQNLALRAILNVVIATHPDRAGFAQLLDRAQRKAEALVVPDDVQPEAKLDGVRDAFRWAAARS